MPAKKILPAIIFLFISLLSLAQPSSKFIGTWEGTLNVGIELRIVFHISEDGNGGFVTTADSPDQSAYELKCDVTTIKNSDLTIKMSDLDASFTGKLVNDSTIEGLFTQRAEFPLVLKKTEKVQEKIRPQTPQPPFPYKSEEVIYSNADQSLQYGATITIPSGKGPFPAIVLITGSGPQDRDETILGHKLFAVIADHLTKKGFIVVRTDDRGVGKSTGIFIEATTEDFAKDVSSSVDYLLSRPEVDKKKVGLVGHSEGGMIAPIVAVKRKDINFIVLLAGPGVPVIDLMAEQNAAIAKASGATDEIAEEIKPLFKTVATAIMNAPDSVLAFATASGIIEGWAATKSKEALAELDFETVSKRNTYVFEMVKEFKTPWFRYFMKFDPGFYLEQLTCKVLALNGEKDIQVISGQNLPGIERSLKKSGSKVYEVKELPGMNHLFQTCTKCNLEEYGKLDETFSPFALQTISDWLLKNIK